MDELPAGGAQALWTDCELARAIAADAVTGAANALLPIRAAIDAKTIRFIRGSLEDAVYIISLPVGQPRAQIIADMPM